MIKTIWLFPVLLMFAAPVSRSQADLGSKIIFGKREEGRSQAWADYYLLAKDGTECKVRRFYFDQARLGDRFSCEKPWQRPANRNLARTYYDY